MNARPTFLVLAAVLAAPVPSAAEQMIGSPADGLDFARENCSECHVVESAQRTAIAHQAPSFLAVADEPKTTETSLRVFLQSPHINMPNFILTRDQTDDVVAYILSLEGSGSN